MKKVYGLWLLAFSLKLFGSGWDTSWHFKYFFDSFSPPHNVNMTGLFLALFLLLYHWGGTDLAERWVSRLSPAKEAFCRKWILMERFGRQRYMDMGSLWIATFGTVLFLVDAPADQAWHYIFGLDLTTWSPTHLILFAGTELAIFGVLLGLYRQCQGKTRSLFGNVALLLFSGFLLEAFLFACGQQEYGYIVLYALNNPNYVLVQHQTTFPIPALLAAAQNWGGPQGLATGSVPTWVYPLYQLLVVTTILQIARRLHQRAWTATAVVALYLGYRLLARFLLHTFDFPVSFVPYYLIGIGVSLDLFGRTSSTRWASMLWLALMAAGATAAVYGGAALIQQAGEVTPPIPLGTPALGFLDGGFPLGFLLACIGSWAGNQVIALVEAQARRQEMATVVAGKVKSGAVLAARDR
jgi:hypothetical protein